MTYHSAPGILSITKKSPTEIIKAVCTFFGVTEDEVKSPSRKIEVVKARQVSQYFIIEVWKMYPGRVGDMFFRDRTTVMHSVKSVNNMIDTDPEYALSVRKIRMMVFNQSIAPVSGVDFVQEEIKKSRLGKVKSRPPAIYSNKSAMGIADEFKNLN